ncbi:hypothetical protein [Hymenobacter cellulosilyticus]|uniref:Lipocalin-like domain-containing protein n=1 Tax=Hymenobacter cellulosilyticus TaxID=2932248 RepID=A0A8T9QFD8_9BACT|nr:hypothetical protein [Hymenobacter cellulosilyticus]UOQ74530.1 hypothetical protein MUN79_12010 [Hymenobacter cellulosilyticus]
MKARYAAWFYTATLLIAGSACSRDSVPTMEDQLVGRWEWVQSASPAVATPASTGHTVEVEFDRRGRARFFQDGAMIGAARFRLKVVGNGWRKSQNLIIYRGYRSQQFYTVTGNKLILQDSENGKGGNIYYKGKHANRFNEVAGKP